MQSQKIKPLYLIPTPNTTPEEIDIALRCIDDILKIAKVNLPVVNLNETEKESLQNPSVIQDNIEQFLEPMRRQVNAERVLDYFDQLSKKPHAQQFNPYQVILTARDIYAPGQSFVIGGASPGKGAIISINRFRNEPMKTETIKQETYHEVGHIFGLPNRNRADLEDRLGLHCIHKCSMRLGFKVPTDWTEFAKDRIKTGQIYCSACTRDLQDFFH